MSDNNFNFPFEPYGIQVQLMSAAYDAYKNRKFALLESPTGTGKSLSIICSSLTWLFDHQLEHKQSLENRKEELIKRIEELKQEEDSGDWLKAQSKRRDVDKTLHEVSIELDKINKFEEKKNARRHAKLHNNPLENYSIITATTPINTGDVSVLNESVLVENEDDDLEKKVSVDSEDEIVRPKIYYASRTHSQLSQFVNEVKRTKFADIDAGPPVKVASLASRANLCVNPDVTKLKDSSAINERCSEMQRESSADKKCPFAKIKGVRSLKEEILSSVLDIEDIVSRGKVTGCCPYYASRMAVAEAELVVVPYNNLLHLETRKASSLDLKDSVIIIDEAHNILETICSIHSATITGQRLLGCHSILSRYYRKFHNMMTPRNAQTIKTIVQCLTTLVKFLNKPQEHIKKFEAPELCDVTESEITNMIEPKSEGKKRSKQLIRREEILIDVLKFVGAANIGRFNIFKIIDYFNRSQLARKLIGFYRQDNTIDLVVDIFDLSPKKSVDERRKKMKPDPCPSESGISTKQKENSYERTSLSFLKATNYGLESSEQLTMTSYPIYALVEFLKSLTNLVEDGRVLIDIAEGAVQQSLLKFVLLNPSGQFRQMTEEARSIILAGGTMQPFNEFTDLLFSPLGIPKSRLTTFSCGHVIGPERLFVRALSTGSSGKPIELSFKTKSSLEVIDEIGKTIQDISEVTPGGMVCFLPSYDYEQLCFNRWTQIGVIRNIETKAKQVFREPRVTNQLKPVLNEFSRVVEKTKGSKRGAMLLCVVGGKMSEGINFNDDLGRCVVMVGLPYANIRSAELSQKIKYYEKFSAGAGQQYYENLCIKGINQSIGRAVRHRKDYAAILLLDRRYSSKVNIRNGLPGWIKGSLKDSTSLKPMIQDLNVFYKAMDQS